MAVKVMQDKCICGLIQRAGSNNCYVFMRSERRGRIIHAMSYAKEGNFDRLLR